MLCCTIASGCIVGDGLVLAAMEVQGGRRFLLGAMEVFALLLGSNGSVGVCVSVDGGVMCLHWYW